MKKKIYGYVFILVSTTVIALVFNFYIASLDNCMGADTCPNKIGFPFVFYETISYASYQSFNIISLFIDVVFWLAIAFGTIFIYQKWLYRVK